MVQRKHVGNLPDQCLDQTCKDATRDYLALRYFFLDSRKVLALPMKLDGL